MPDVLFKLPKWIVEITDLGYYCRHAQTVMDSQRVVSVLYSVNRSSGDIEWRVDPEDRLFYMKPVAIQNDILVATVYRGQMGEGYDGTYRFNALTGEPLLIERPSTFLGRWQHKRDVRDLNTFYTHFSPALVREGEVVSESGSVHDLVTGKHKHDIVITPALLLSVEPLHDQFFAHYAQYHHPLYALRPGGILYLEGIGTLRAGDPNLANIEVKANDYPFRWFLTDKDENVLWTWNAADESELGNLVGGNGYHQINFSPPYIFLLVSDAHSSQRYLAVFDLRVGHVVQILPVCGKSTDNPKIDSVDNGGVLVRHAEHGASEILTYMTFADK